jgi:hypothetical protein
MVKEHMETLHPGRIGSQDDQRVVRILEHKTWRTVEQRVAQERVLAYHLLQDIRNKKEHVWRQWVALPQSPLIVDPSPRDAIQ